MLLAEGQINIRGRTQPSKCYLSSVRELAREAEGAKLERRGPQLSRRCGKWRLGLERQRGR